MTPTFAAPEQHLRKTTLKPYTDVYALAASLYRLVTNEYPVSAPSRALGDLLPEPIEINPYLSSQVNTAILRGMELNPYTRSQSIEEWLSLLPSSTADPVPKDTAHLIRRKVFDRSLLANSDPSGADLSPTKTFSVSQATRIPDPPATVLDLDFQERIAPSRAILSKLRSFTFRVVSVGSQGEIIQDEQKQGQQFVEDLGSGITLRMIRIPPGQFQMGSEKAEAGHCQTNLHVILCKLQTVFSSVDTRSRRLNGVLLAVGPKFNGNSLWIRLSIKDNFTL